MTDQPAPSGNGQEPKFTFPAINQTITYHDGSTMIELYTHEMLCRRSCIGRPACLCLRV